MFVQMFIFILSLVLVTDGIKKSRWWSTAELWLGMCQAVVRPGTPSCFNWGQHFKMAALWSLINVLYGLWFFCRVILKIRFLPRTAIFVICYGGADVTSHPRAAKSHLQERRSWAWPTGVLADERRRLDGHWINTQQVQFFSRVKRNSSWFITSNLS